MRISDWSSDVCSSDLAVESVRAQVSLARRMVLIASGWIAVLLIGGGIALDRSMTSLVEENFDEQLTSMLTAMIASAEIGPAGEVFFYRPLGDQRFLEPGSGLYWQIDRKRVGKGKRVSVRVELGGGRIIK